MALRDIFLNHQGNVIHKWKHYFPAYTSHFERYVNRPVFILEIGVSKGGSLQMWKKYFGPHALIVGIDIDEACKRLEEDQVHIRIGDQADISFLDRVLQEFGTPDIVLDDGSHVMTDVRTSFEFLYPRMSSSGIYFVEDMHTSYWEEYGGGLGQPETFIEMSKRLIDELNGDWARNQNVKTEFTATTQSIHFYDSCVVFEKGKNSSKTAPQIGRQGTFTDNEPKK
jgi:cephalosporin hydroxylase